MVRKGETKGHIENKSRRRTHIDTVNTKMGIDMRGRERLLDLGPTEMVRLNPLLSTCMMQEENEKTEPESGTEDSEDEHLTPYLRVRSLSRNPGCSWTHSLFLL